MCAGRRRRARPGRCPLRELTLAVAALAAGAVVGAPARADEPPVAPRARVLGGHGGVVRSVSFGADGRSVISASFDGSVLVRDATTGGTRSRFDGVAGGAYWCGVSADGRTVALGGRGPVVRVADRNGVREFRHPADAWAGALTPDGSRVVAAGTDGTVVIRGTADGREHGRFTVPGPVGWCALSPDGTLIAATSGGSVFVHTVGSASLVRVLASHPAGLYGVAWSPDGNLLATAGGDATAQVHRVSDGATVLRLPHFAAVQCVAFSPDGATLATGSADSGVRLWDASTGRLTAMFLGAGQPVWGLAWSPDGRTVACGGDAGTVVLWEPGGEPVLPPATAPAVDLRPALARFGLGVVAQRERNTCSVHTMARAVEFALSRREGRGVPLSDEFLNWGCNRVIGNTGPGAADRGQWFEHLWMGLQRTGVCRRGLMPWTERFDPGNTPSPEALADGEARRARVAFSIRWINGPGVGDAEAVARVKAVLAAGWPLAAGSPHSVRVTGYEDDLHDPGGGRFPIADSGTGGFVDRVTGDRLHSAIPYARVRDYGFFWVVAHEPFPRMGEEPGPPAGR